MKKKFTILLVAAFALPFLALLWLGLGLARDQERLVEQNLRDLRLSQLNQAKAAIRSEFEKIGAALASGFDRTRSAKDLPAVQRGEGLALQVFEFNYQQELVWPNPKGLLSKGEQAFLTRVENLRETEAFQDIFAWMAETKSYPERGASRGGASTGWLPWYWEDGVHFLYWQRVPRGIVGTEVEPVVLVSRLVAVLPEGKEQPHLVRLEDGAGKAVYQWGALALDGDVAPDDSIALDPPLQSWRLSFYGAGQVEQSLSRSTLLGFGLVFLAVLLAGGGLIYYLVRETGRDLREAGQRVNFVNQVSHELKTPLTNIRLYAELLQDRLDDEDSTSKKQLGIIAAESQRLSRLIGNILNFSRKQRKALKLRLEKQPLDPVVSAVMERFEPALKDKGIQMKMELNCPTPFPLDRDAVEQVLANLVSNVEKYAAQGKSVVVSTRQDPRQAWLRVEDQGPGIAARDAARIFEPYTRLDNSLTAQAAGTGIGLGLARDLMRLHGGDLKLAESKKGAAFEAWFPLENREEKL